ncbi:lachesin-like isoform X3 [Acropora muricata]|uniref:lachesin-like isoform X3 n=1 Tax=Acropora muricata TaxID=159855 RepID=UPI0034E4DAFF
MGYQQLPIWFTFHHLKVAMGILSLNCCSSAKMSFALCCMLFGILVVFPETDGTSITWHEPLPILTVQESDSTKVVHRSHTRLIEGTINASLSWYFKLSSALTLLGVNLKLGTVNVATVISQKQEVLAGFKENYAINWIPNQRITLVIFKVTTEQNATFACEVFAEKTFISIWRSRVQVDVVAPPSNIITSSDQNVIAPAELTLNCSADGKPKPTITWTRVSDNTAVTMPLTISSGKNGESFRCTADNGVGIPLTKDVYINILFSPKVTLRKKFFVGREQTASLFCQVEGNPKPTISWSPCDPPNVLCDKQYLNISKVQTARANFNCTATNALGEESASTVLLYQALCKYSKLLWS